MSVDFAKADDEMGESEGVKYAVDRGSLDICLDPRFFLLMD